MLLPNVTFLEESKDSFSLVLISSEALKSSFWDEVCWELFIELTSVVETLSSNVVSILSFKSSSLLNSGVPSAISSSLASFWESSLTFLPNLRESIGLSSCLDFKIDPIPNPFDKVDFILDFVSSSSFSSSTAEELTSI